MEFIGIDGWPAPLLKDVTLSESKARELYLQCIQIVRNIYWKCRLVHADLSEFNLLYEGDKLYVIDVSQSVEHDHPHALEFLRKDCTNVTEFFKKNGVCVMTVKELFDFVTDPNINDGNMEDYLEKAQSIAANRDVTGNDPEEIVKEEVFKKVYIPRTLDEVAQFEKDADKAKEGKGDEILYSTLTGMKRDLTGVQDEPELLKIVENFEAQLMDSKIIEDDCHEEAEGSDDTSDSDGESEDQEENGSEEKAPVLTRKEKKKLVKEANRERRKTKTPKHVKKRREKLAKTKYGRN